MNENLEGKGGGTTFRAGVTAPFVASLPAAGSGAPASLYRGGCECRVMAAPSVPKGICSLHHGCSHSVGVSSYCFSLKDGQSETLNEIGRCQAILLGGDVV
jgi:hypothetical protein